MGPYNQFLTEQLGPNWKGPVFFAVFALVCLLLAARLLLEQLRMASAARRLDQAQGVIDKVEVSEWNQGGKRKAAIEIVVDFKVDGRDHVCRRYDLYRASTGFERYQPAPLLHVGDTVAVSYDPRNPSACALAVGRPNYAPGLVALVAAAAFFALALAMRG